MQRISSNMINNDFNYHLRGHEVKISQVENQMGSQKKIQNLRDDPVSAAHSTRYQSWITRLNQFDNNTSFLQDNLRIMESHISKAQDIIQRLNELSIQGAHGTYSPEDLRYMGLEANELLNELVVIANAKGTDGQLLFSGDRINTPAFRVLEGRVAGHDSPLVTEVQYMGTLGENLTEIGENAFIKSNFPGNKVFWAEQQKIYSSVDSQNYQVPFDTFIAVDGQEIQLRAGDNVQSIIAKMNTAPAGIRASLDPVTNGLIIGTTQPHQLWLEDAQGSSVLRDLGLITDRGGMRPPHNISQDARLFGGSIFDAVIQLRDNMLSGNSEYLGGQGVASIHSSLKNLQTILAELGARDTRLSVAKQGLAAETVKVIEKNAHLTDLDITEGITRLKMLEHTHQAALKAASRIFTPSLMDFLR